MTNEKTSATRRAKGEGSIFKNKKGRWVARSECQTGRI